MASSDDYDAFFIRRLPTGAAVWLCSRKDLSQFFGWDQQFEEFYAGKGLGTLPPGHRWYGSLGPRGAANGGHPFRVLRGPKKGVFTAGLTHSFRLRGTWSMRDVRQVAQAIRVDWNWIKFPDGRVFEKDQLLHPRNYVPGLVAGTSR